MKKTIVLVLGLISQLSFGQTYLHTEGKKIVDGNGKNVLLRGLGLGGWMVQEGYMLKTSEFAGPQHKIQQKIKDLIGDDAAKQFYDTYLKNGVTKRDIDSLKAWGFNSVRLPMHYNLYTLPVEEENNGEITWLKKGFEITDSLLVWCAENEMYLILDLHAAPGGQGHDANISDYDSSKASLWESAKNQKKIVAFWRKIAERYKDETWIGGYDIINEPNWNFEGENENGCDETRNEPLRSLMVEITEAIREVDPNHIIFIEGNCWGNNYQGIFPLWDNNTVISFHKYWNYNTQEALQQVLDYREQENAPIWLGESGENSNVWFRDAIKLIESNNIGWAFWPMKKVDNMAGVTSVKFTQDYQKLLSYWENGGEKPSQKFATNALMELAENYKMENVTILPDVIDAMFRQVQSDKTVPYSKNLIPGIIYASEYDFGTNGIAYSDLDFVNYWVSTGENTAWNKGNKMRNDGVDIQICHDQQTNGFEVFDIQQGEWLLYTVHVEQTGSYDIEFRYSSETENGKINLEIEGRSQQLSIDLPVTGNAENYSTETLSKVSLKKGSQKIKVFFEKGDFNLNYLKFTKN